jgi:dCMP deaminase
MDDLKPDINKIKAMLQVAFTVASLSTCKRRSVGAVITDDEFNILSTGYNGVPKKYPHCKAGHTECSDKKSVPGLDLESCYAIHAEQNALIKLADHNKAKMIFTTTQPCIHCAKMIANTGIKHIYYVTDYSHSGVANLFIDCGITMEKVNYVS